MCERRKPTVEQAATTESCERCGGCRLRVIGEMAPDARLQASDISSPPAKVEVVCAGGRTRPADRHCA